MSSERRRISLRCTSVRGSASGSEAMLSQISPTRRSRSATLSRRMSGREIEAMFKGYYVPTGAFIVPLALAFR